MADPVVGWQRQAQWDLEAGDVLQRADRALVRYGKEDGVVVREQGERPDLRVRSTLELADAGPALGGELRRRRDR